jgi:hypothetical protein
LDLAVKGKSEVRAGLSARGLAKFPRNTCEKDFTFIVGEDRCGRPPSTAASLPPRLGHLQSSDSTLREFASAAKDPESCFHVTSVSTEDRLVSYDEIWFLDNNAPNSWTCYDFDNMTIKPIHADRQRVGLILMLSKSQ